MLEDDLKIIFENLGWKESDKTGIYSTEELLLNTTFSNGTYEYNVKEFKRTYVDGTIMYIRSSLKSASNFRMSEDALKHNLAGPAVIFPDGKTEYWISGFQFNEENYNKVINHLLLG